MSTYAPSRLYRTRVTAVTALSPHFVRITVAAADLQYFGGHGFDQRLKLLFPAAEGLPPLSFFERPVAEWYPEWRELPTAQRGSMRTYTVRHVRPESGELDIDFVLHGVHGPASAWATTATVGAELLVLGPDARANAPVRDIDWKPGDATRLLIAGDETAAPAIAAILGSLGPEVSGEAFIEVPTARDALEIPHPAKLTVTWLAREGLGSGDVLRTAVAAWGERHTATADPAEPFYAWLAGESGIATGLRRTLVRDLGVDRKAVSFMGYWKMGAAEQN